MAIGPIVGELARETAKNLATEVAKETVKELGKKVVQSYNETNKILEQLESETYQEVIPLARGATHRVPKSTKMGGFQVTQAEELKKYLNNRYGHPNENENITVGDNVIADAAAREAQRIEALNKQLTDKLNSLTMDEFSYKLLKLNEWVNEQKKAGGDIDTINGIAKAEEEKITLESANKITDIYLGEWSRQLNAKREFNANMLKDQKDLTDQYNKLTMSEKGYANWNLQQEKVVWEEKYANNPAMLKQYRELYDVKLGKVEQMDAKSDPFRAREAAIQQIKAQTVDYSKTIVQAYEQINASAENHWVKMLSGQESFSQGMKSVVKDMTASIMAMWARMIYQQMIYQPLQQMFIGMFGGGSNASSVDAKTGSTNMGTFKALDRYASGGNYPGGWAVVGEEGPELINFTDPGRIYTANDTQQMLSNKQSSNAPTVIVNVTNNSKSDVQVSRQTQWDSGAQRMIVEMVIDAKERNVLGLRDAFAT